MLHDLKHQMGAMRTPSLKSAIKSSHEIPRRKWPQIRRKRLQQLLHQPKSLCRRLSCHFMHFDAERLQVEVRRVTHKDHWINQRRFCYNGQSKQSIWIQWCFVHLLHEWWQHLPKIDHYTRQLQSAATFKMSVEPLQWAGWVPTGDDQAWSTWGSPYVER